MVCTPLRPLRVALAALGFTLGGGCGGAPTDDTGGSLPPAESADSGTDEGLDSFRVDTSLGDTGFDGTPAHTLTLTHEGRWMMTPNGGPWLAMTGTLHVTETVDEGEPACELTIALTGEVSEESCAECDATFDILYYVSEGDRSLCSDPELPQDQSTVTMAWSDARQAVLLDYEGSGVWVDWYAGDRVDDLVTFDWTATVGLDVDTGM